MTYRLVFLPGATEGILADEDALFVQVAPEVAAELADWSEPVRVRVEPPRDGTRLVEIQLRKDHRVVLGEGELNDFDDFSGEYGSTYLRLDDESVAGLIADALPAKMDETRQAASYGRWRVVLERIEDPAPEKGGLERLREASDG